MPAVNNAAKCSLFFEFLKQRYLNLGPKLIDRLPSTLYSEQTFLGAGECLFFPEKPRLCVWREFKILFHVLPLLRGGRSGGVPVLFSFWKLRWSDEGCRSSVRGDDEENDEAEDFRGKVW